MHIHLKVYIIKTIKREERRNMKIYINGELTTRENLEELIGKDSLERKIEEAWETFQQDPLIENSWFLGSKGMLTIEF